MQATTSLTGTVRAQRNVWVQLNVPREIIGELGSPDGPEDLVLLRFWRANVVRSTGPR